MLNNLINKMHKTYNIKVYNTNTSNIIPKTSRSYHIPDIMDKNW